MSIATSVPWFARSARALDGNRTAEPVRALDGGQEHLGVPASPDRVLDLVAPGTRCIEGRRHRFEEHEGRVEDAGQP
jgi:hypothetical protein